jgi:hypothetical protein
VDSAKYVILTLTPPLIYFYTWAGEYDLQAMAGYVYWIKLHSVYMVWINRCSCAIAYAQVLASGVLEKEDVCKERK